MSRIDGTVETQIISYLRSRARSLFLSPDELESPRDGNRQESFGI